MKINKAHLIFPIIVLSAGVLLGACTHQAEDVSTNEGGAETNSVASDNSQMALLENYMKSGDSARCTISDSEDPSFQAEYLLKDGKIKVISTDPETNSRSYVISENNAGYVWVEGEDTGITYSYEEGAELDDRLGQYDDNDFAPEEEIIEEPDEYADDTTVIDCTPADIKDSEFELPANVNFQNMNDLMQQAIDEAGAEAGMPENMEDLEAFMAE